MRQGSPVSGQSATSKTARHRRRLVQPTAVPRQRSLVIDPKLPDWRREASRGSAGSTRGKCTMAHIGNRLRNCLQLDSGLTTKGRRAMTKVSLVVALFITVLVLPVDRANAVPC